MKFVDFVKINLNIFIIFNYHKLDGKIMKNLKQITQNTNE